MNSYPSSNGFPHRRVENEIGMKQRSQFVKHTEYGEGAGKMTSPSSHDMFVYLTTCKIGHHVEVHLKNGSVYTGIFHAADVENNFGIILKMATLIKEGNSTLVSKPPSKILIIPGDELVQVIAKDLPVYCNDVSNSVEWEKPLELLTDSLISQSYRVDLERELQPWMPDEDIPNLPDLENVFDNPWKRGWNQFEVNETLFGVTSTFDEELYTTKLDRGGPRNRELEEQALRIAREIEGENTRDLHVAEERGLELSGKFDIDEETKYSSVCPVNGFDDNGYEEEDEEEEILLNCCNNLTFGDSSASNGRVNDSLPSRDSTKTIDQSLSNSNKHAWQVMFEQPSVSSALKGINEDTATPGGGWPGSSISRNTAVSSPSSRPILSPSSSIGSYSSEKSTLNPNAKEFKLNPNAKSFKPSPTTSPKSPVNGGSFYFPRIPPHMMGLQIGYGMGAAFPGQQQQQQQQQPMMFSNNTTHQMGPNHTYYSPHGPQFTQQMIVGQQRPVLFMPPTPYQPEMPYKGRDSY